MASYNFLVEQVACRMLIAKPVPEPIVTFHDDVIKWKHWRVTGPLWGECTVNRWIPLTKASDSEMCIFLWSAPKETVEQTIESLMIRDAIMLIITLL